MFSSQRVQILINSPWGSTKLVCCFCCLMSPVDTGSKSAAAGPSCPRLGHGTPLPLERLGKDFEQSFDSTSQDIYGGFISHDLVPPSSTSFCDLRTLSLMLELTTSSVALLAGLTVLTWYLIMPSFFSRPIDFTGKVSFKNITHRFKSRSADP